MKIVKKKTAEKPAAPALPAATAKPSPTQPAKGVATVTKEHVAKGERGKDETLSSEKTMEHVGQLSISTTDNPAKVNFNSSYKHGLDNYSSVSVGVSLTLPCAVEDIDKTYEFATEWVSSRLEQLMVDIGAREPGDITADVDENIPF